jgi:hypothetical protein
VDLRARIERAFAVRLHPASGNRGKLPGEPCRSG